MFELTEEDLMKSPEIGPAEPSPAAASDTGASIPMANLTVSAETHVINGVEYTEEELASAISSMQDPATEWKL